MDYGTINAKGSISWLGTAKLAVVNSLASVQNFAGTAFAQLVAGGFGLGRNSDGLPRWRITGDGTAESSTRTGYNFKLEGFDNAGSSLGSAFIISRDTFQATFNGNLYTPNSVYAGSSLPIGMLTPAGTASLLTWQNSSTLNKRWEFGKDGVAESGSNIGSNFVLSGYSDAGALLGNYLAINRATGQATFTSINSGVNIVPASGNGSILLTPNVGGTDTTSIELRNTAGGLVYVDWSVDASDYNFRMIANSTSAFTFSAAGAGAYTFSAPLSSTSSLATLTQNDTRVATTAFVRDASRPVVVATQLATPQSIPHNTATLIQWLETSDADNAFSSNVFTVPTGCAGIYAISVDTILSAQSAQLFLGYKKNAGAVVNVYAMFDSNAINTLIASAFSIMLNLAAGDTLSFYIQQFDNPSASTRTMQRANLVIARIGDAS